jgi:uncharacterized protein YbjT (DUF2867 family)
MRIAIVGPTGHVGGVVADRLVQSGHRIQLLTRHPEKVRHLAERGASVTKGSLTDKAFVREATQRMDALFWFSPVDPKTTDFRREHNLLGDNVAAAVNANRIVRVVNLSSLGAQHAKGTGIIAGLHDVEEHLNRTGAYITHVRGSWFYENYLQELEAIRESGSLCYSFPPEMPMPQAATRDIGLYVADRLLDESWRGRRVVELYGPDDLTLRETAAAIGRGLRREARYVQIPAEEERKALFSFGLGESYVAGLAEMHAAIASGLVRQRDPKAETVRGTTTLEDFSRSVLLPALGASVS